MRSPGWVVSAGQSATVTRPPDTAAAARNGVALDRSGSTCQVRPRISPLLTWKAPPFSGVSSRTSTPASRSMATVMSMCGRDGTSPSGLMVSPLG